MMRVALVITFWLGMHLATSCQNSAQGQLYVYLPPARGATALSAYIDSQARYTEAAGDYLESVAAARVLHAEAWEKESQALDAEIDSRYKWLEYYYESKLMRREYRRKLNPSLIDKQKKNDAKKIELLNNHPATLIKHNLIGTMNWMLVQMATDQQAPYLLFSNTAREQFGDVDLHLSQQDVAGLTLCLLERSQGHQITFRADQGSALTSTYPLVLRKASFDEKRATFEQLKHQILEDCRDGSIDNSTLAAAETVIGQFREAIELEYPRESRKGNPRIYFEHKSGIDFLGVQQAAITLAVESNNPSGLNGDYAFQGNSVVDLLAHMARRGMQFAAPSAGQRHIYQKVFLGMRNIYLSMDVSIPAENEQKVSSVR
jgi:hypothetical protein